MSQKQARAARRAAAISSSTSFQAQLDAAVVRHRAEPKPLPPARARRKLPSPVAGLTVMVAATAGIMGSFLFHDTTPAPAAAPSSLTVADILPAPAATAIRADPHVAVNFTRTSVRTSTDPDHKLNAMMAAAAGHPDKNQESATLSSPVKDPVRTSPFGTRTSPITGQVDEFHTGQDFGSPCGADVTAAAGGTVVFAGWHDGGGGNRVEIDHGNGLKTTYNHLESFHVSVGQHLKRGEPLGKVGSTGASTGCHLHFETWLNGELTDPVPWL
jgi:murein DD-endopeptidase MepM/ murein hydrolase activator NlpD